MKTYLFTTTATMKEYNRANFWIDPDLLRPYTVNAPDLKKAFSEYIEHARERSGAEISENAIKRKSPIFIDGADGKAVQVGYCITAKYYFYDDNYRASSQYIDFWVNIDELKNPFISE